MKAQEKFSQSETELRLKIISKIGQGTFGKVYSAYDLKSQQLVAVKKIAFNDFMNENFYMENLVHPNIVKFIRIANLNNSIFIIMELMQGGSLRDALNYQIQNLKEFNENEVSYIMKQILSAVELMHSKQIVHRDLKLDNILLKDKRSLEIKIGDFGLSYQLNNDQNTYKQLFHPCGTFYFMAPELLNSQYYSKPVDIWSCGIIMYMLLSGSKHPFLNLGESKENYGINLASKTLIKTNNMSDLAFDLIKRLLKIDQYDRYSAGQAINHPWITRNLESQIPMTPDETQLAFRNSLNFMSKIKTLMLINKIKDKSKQKQKYNLNLNISVKDTYLQDNYNQQQIPKFYKINNRKFKLVDFTTPSNQQQVVHSSRYSFTFKKQKTSQELYSTPQRNMFHYKISYPSISDHKQITKTYHIPKTNLPPLRRSALAK